MAESNLHTALSSESLFEDESHGLYDLDDLCLPNDSEIICPTKKEEFAAEEYDFECLDEHGVQRFLEADIRVLSDAIRIQMEYAAVLLRMNKWDHKACAASDKDSLVALFRRENEAGTGSLEKGRATASLGTECEVCADVKPVGCFRALKCGHRFCKHCWKTHAKLKVAAGSSRVICMAEGCSVLAHDDFLKAILSKSMLTLYAKFLHRDDVNAHPLLRLCRGRGCPLVFKVKKAEPKEVTCSSCLTSSCFQCGQEYHPPITCEVYGRWVVLNRSLVQNADFWPEAEKVCPVCATRILKEGGCNEVTCTACHHRFCWFCRQALSNCDSEHMPCGPFLSKLNNPDIASVRSFFHYHDKFAQYARWIEHSKRYDEHRVMFKSQAFVGVGSASPSDVECILEATQLLVRCKRFLQFSFVQGYFMSEAAVKDLFEFQQGNLEKEVAELVECVDQMLEGTSYPRSLVRTKMFVVQKLGASFLEEFFTERL